MDELGNNGVSKEMRLGPQDFGNLAWAFAKLAILHKPLFKALSKGGIAKMQQFPPQNVANLAWAFATLLVEDSPLMAAISSYSLQRRKEFETQHLAHVFWSFASLAVVDKRLFDACAMEAVRKAKEFNCQEVANTAWAVAKLGFINKPLLQAVAAVSSLRMAEFVPQDVAAVAWAFAKIAFVDLPLLAELAARAQGKISEFNPQDLANTAWAMAQQRYCNAQLMDSFSGQVWRTLGQFEASDFSSTAWSFSTLAVPDGDPLMTAVSAEVVKKLDSLGAQQLGTLADLDLPCSSAVRRLLQDLVHDFARQMPRTLAEYRAGRYARLLRDFEVDCFGSFGDRLLLNSLGIHEAPEDFFLRAAARVAEYENENRSFWWRSEGLMHQRVLSYAELELRLPGSSAVVACRLQQNGYQGSRPLHPFLIATTLPLNGNVDRGLCSEFQLLEKCLEDLSAGSTAKLAGATGWLQLFVTGPPCLSCAGAMHQFKLEMPLVLFSVSIGEELQYRGMN